MSRVKVLHLITELVWGGAQDNTLLTVERLDRERFEVHVAAAPRGDWEDRARSVADRLHIIPSMRRGIYALQNARAFLEIVALLRREKYQVVHTHSTNAGILGRAAARAVGVPVIVHTVHGFGFNDVTFPQWVRTLLTWLERLAARCCDRLIMVSELNKLEALEKRVAPADKLVTVYSGIDMAPFEGEVDVELKRSHLSLSDGSPVVGMVGRLSECNGPDSLVRAALKVLQERSNVQFLVVGDGPMRTQIEGLAQDAHQVKFLGYRADVPCILPVFDVFVSPARWGGLGRALTEAMIAARPVVATSVNGVPEIVRHGETGLLVPPDDPEAIAHAISYLLDNPDVAKRLGENARELVVPEFSADLMVQRIAALYEDLLALKGLTRAGL